jgi:hypothetical protein
MTTLRAKPDDKFTEVVFSPHPKVSYVRVDWERREVVTALIPLPTPIGEAAK